MFNFFKPKQKKDTLTFYHEYQVSRSYSNVNKRKNKTLESILSLFKSRAKVNSEWHIYVESKYNGFIYPMFDLDNITNKNNFEIIYKDVPYVMFQSSVDHYWGILGNVNKNIFTDVVWLSCNDTNYASMAKSQNLFVLRGLYKTLDRKPTLIKSNGVLDNNFKNFVDSLSSFYNNESLELSILKYKDPKMLLKFDRKLKLKKISKMNEN